MTGNVAPGGKGAASRCHMPDQTRRFRLGERISSRASPTSWVHGLIVPSSHNSNSSMFKVTVAGTSASGSGPNPWGQIACARQSDGTCTGSSSFTVSGGVTFQNIGVVTTKPSTAIFDPGLYYLGAGGLSLGPNSSARMSTAAGRWVWRRYILFQHVRDRFGHLQYWEIERLYIRLIWLREPQ